MYSSSNDGKPMIDSWMLTPCLALVLLMWAIARYQRRLDRAGRIRGLYDPLTEAGRADLRRALALVVAEALLFFDDKQYVLDDWVIMPNHVHIIIWPMPNFTLSKILHSRKTFTAREANRMLGRIGETFWQRESYDHWVRDQRQFNKIVSYIEDNPVRAGLCLSPADYPWSHAGRIAGMAS
jgi:REP element-mobilizing transposase RayT